MYDLEMVSVKEPGDVESQEVGLGIAPSLRARTRLPVWIS